MFFKTIAEKIAPEKEQNKTKNEKNPEPSKLDEKTEKNLLSMTVDEIWAISDTVVNVIKSKCSDYKSLYENEEARGMVLKLFEYFNFPVSIGIKSLWEFKNLIEQFFEEKFGMSKSDIDKDPKKMCTFLVSKLYNNYLKLLQSSVWLWTSFLWDLFNRDKMYECLYGLLDIGELKDKEIKEEIYKNVYALDLQKLEFDTLDSFKEYVKEEEWKDLDIKTALKELKEKSDTLYASNQIEWIYTTEELKKNKKNIDAPGSNEKRTPKEQKYMEYIKKTQGNVLSKSDYDKLFGNLYKHGQGNLWDCYFVATLRAITRMKEFDTLIRTSLRCNKDGSYTVRLPLWEPKWIDINVSPEELELELLSHGRDWYKILEVAYVKYMTPHKDKISEEDLKHIEAWTWEPVMKALLWNEWYKVESYNPIKIKDLMKMPQKNEEILDELKNFDPEKGDIITAINLNTSWGEREWAWLVIHSWHVLCVTKVKKDKDWNVVGVEIENPRNDDEYGKQLYYLPISDFFNFATIVDCGHTTDKFLDTESSKYAEAEILSNQAKNYFNNMFKVPGKHMIKWYNDAQKHWWIFTNYALSEAWKHTKEDVPQALEDGRHGLSYWVDALVSGKGEQMLENWLEKVKDIWNKISDWVKDVWNKAKDLYNKIKPSWL